MKRILLLTALLAAPLAAHADQFQYNTLPNALKALQVLETSDSVKLFCAPCNDVTAKTVKRNSSSLGLVFDDLGKSTQPYRDGGQSYWEVYINDRAVDLAYVYVRKDNQWRNLAQTIGLSPTSVPKTIP